MENLNVKIKYFESLAKKIEESIESNNLDQAQQQLNKYSRAIANSPKYCYQAILYFQNGDIDSAIKELEEG